MAGTSVPRYMFLSLPPPLENPPCHLSCFLLTMDNCFCCSAHPSSPHPPIEGAMTWGLVPGPPPGAKSLLNYRTSREPGRASPTHLQPRVGCSALCWAVKPRVRPSSHSGCPARCWTALLLEATRTRPWHGPGLAPISQTGTEGEFETFSARHTGIFSENL